MKCPYCGAEIEDGQYCTYCGSKISSDMQREQERLKKRRCPRCGSTNLIFQRENQGEIYEENSKRVINQTVAICEDCGYSWTDSKPLYQSTQNNMPQKKRKTWLWILGWIIIFPLPLTLILLKKKDMKPVPKYLIIAFAWIFYFAIAIFSDGTDQPVSGQYSFLPAESRFQTVAEFYPDIEDSIYFPEISV